MSVFKIATAGAVGTGSIRGMPYLATLREAGFSIWPFDSASDATVVEIYPKGFYKTERVVKTDRTARADYLSRYPSASLSAVLMERAVSTDDAFDAAVSAIAMSQCMDQLTLLKRDSDHALEGKIWRPNELA